MTASRTSVSPRAFALVAFTALTVACGGSEKAAQTTTTAADVIAGQTGAFERFESKGGNFTIEFPSVWRGGYSALEGADTSDGARFRVQFVFRPEAAMKVEPKALLVVRIFSKAAWTKAAARPGQPIAVKVAERGDDVFTLSLPKSNPYKPGTSEAARYDQLILSVVQDKSGLRLTPK